MPSQGYPAFFQSDKRMVFPCIAEHDVIRYGISPWLVEVTCPVVCRPPPPRAYCPPPSLFTAGAKRETEAALMLCKCWSAKAGRLVRYQYGFGQSSKPQHRMSCHEEN